MLDIGFWGLGFIIVDQPLSTSAIISQVADSKTITARSKSNFSSSFFFLPPEKRHAIQNIYAFFRVVDDVVDEEIDPLKQKELLDAWKRELISTYKDLTIVPLLKELKTIIDRFKIPQQHFLLLIEGCEMDITKKRYATFNELYDYCYRVASMVGLVCMKIFEYESPTSEEAAINLGVALQLTNIIRDVGVDLQKGRIYLPMEDLDKFGVTEADLISKKKTESFLKLMNFQYERALTYYEKGMSELKKDKEKKLLVVRIMAEVYRHLLKKIKRRRYPVLNKRIRLHLHEKLALLVSTLYSHYLR